jgi:hypothetical protein
MIAPHALFQVWSPDQVAEALDGVDKVAYRELWKLVPLYDELPRSEVGDDFEDRALAKFWDRLDEATQFHLNEVAKAAYEDWGF